MSNNSTVNTQTLYTRIGSQIRKYRTDSKLSQLDLSRAVGIGKTTVQRIEDGAPCSVAVLHRLAEVFDCTLDDLVPVVVEESPTQMMARFG
jgi:transcriptional regulator with XRE-family HTH domain